MSDNNPYDPNRPQDPNQPPTYGQYGAGQYGQGGYGGQPVQDHPQGTTILVLGILSLICCQILGPVAWIMGKKAVAEIDANPGRYGGRDKANIGKILGIIGTVLFVLGLIATVFYGIAIVSALDTAQVDTTY